MPIYAYRCAACGYEKDVLQKMSDAPLTQCPECGKDSFAKQVTAAGFQLKGSGWYVTDFRGGNQAKAAAGTAPAASEATAGTAGGDAAPGAASSSSPAGSGAAPAASSDKSSGSAGSQTGKTASE
jgi:putative FmdB family regulatory protein